MGGMGTPSAAGSIFGGEVERFAPQLLTANVSKPAVMKALDSGDRSKAMILALALNDHSLLRKTYQSVPVADIPVVISSIGSLLLPALLWFLSMELKPASGTPHFQFHVNWIAAIIDLHFQTLLDMSPGKATARTGTALEAAATSRSDVAALCLQLLVELSQRHAQMSKIFEGNIYLLRYLSNAPPEEAEKEEEEEEANVAAAIAAAMQGQPSHKGLSSGNVAAAIAASIQGQSSHNG